MKSIFLVFCSLFMFVSLQAQSVWQSSDDAAIYANFDEERGITPQAYATFELDAELMKFKLSDAPSEDDPNRWRNAVSMDLPMPDGSLETFIFVESPVMEEGISARYPEIKTYRGVSIEDRYKKARIGYAPISGFHASVRSLEGDIYIDAYFADSSPYYNSYYTKDDLVDQSLLSGTCGTEYTAEDLIAASGQGTAVQTRGYEDPVIRREYRLAVATTGEWGRFFGSVAATLEKIVQGVNRVNQSLENEAAVFFKLIDDNDKVIFIDPDTDPYDPGMGHQGRQVLGQNTAVLNQYLDGPSSYDVGHVFTRGCTDGIAGVASFGSVCGNNKGNGVSCVGLADISAFMVGTTIHELGHQFACSHSWSNCPGAQENVSAGTSWEIGSGITFMSYAGACGSQNLAGTNDAYYHTGNLNQFYDFMTFAGGNNCGEQIETDNHCPIVSTPYPNGLNIPINTPFELTGIAEDPDDDAMTFNWEQMDVAAELFVGQFSFNGPQFTSYPPNENPDRIIPRLQNLLSGIGSSNEILPSDARSYSFRFTARDNHPEAGIASWTDLSFNSTNAAGPFRVSYPDEPVSVEVGKSLEVMWDVAGTDGVEVNCQFVDIYLSTNSGLNFDRKLATKVPNTGAATVLMPNEVSSNCRIKVKASNNMFFNISRPNFKIVEPANPGFYFDLAFAETSVCLPAVVELPINGTSFQSFENPVTLEVTEGLPVGAVATFSQNPMMPGENSVLSIDLNGTNVTGRYDIKIQGIAEDADPLVQPFILNIQGTDFSDLALISPESNTVQSGQATFEWSTTLNADSYDFELATSPAFGDDIVASIYGTLSNAYSPTIVLEKSSLYYWRVLANNSCIAYPSETYLLATEALQCEKYFSEDLPRNISGSGLPTVESRMYISAPGQVSDVNVRNIKGLHEDISDIVGTIISPAGTEVVLFDQICFNSSDFNAGFDDESTLNLACPLANNITYIPEESLSVFNGEDIEGDWILRLEDKRSGNGGQFQRFELQLCSNQSLASPTLVVNETLEVLRGFGQYVLPSSLLTEDDNNDAGELIYTVVNLPAHGELTRFGVALNVGDQFSQFEVDNYSVVYQHDGGAENDDMFQFTVIDGEGGWIGITNFNIVIGDSGISTSTIDEGADLDQFKIFPNPTSNVLFVQNLNIESNDVWEGEILDIMGRKVESFEVSRSSISKVDVQSFTEGLYFVRIRNAQKTKTYPVTVVKN